jgi:hypothetical protein
MDLSDDGQEYEQVGCIYKVDKKGGFAPVLQDHGYQLIN